VLTSTAGALYRLGSKLRAGQIEVALIRDQHEKTGKDQRRWTRIMPANPGVPVRCFLERQCPGKFSLKPRDRCTHFGQIGAHFAHHTQPAKKCPKMAFFELQADHRQFTAAFPCRPYPHPVRQQTRGLVMQVCLSLMVERDGLPGYSSPSRRQRLRNRSRDRFRRILTALSES
jgi:hypothetical protein